MCRIALPLLAAIFVAALSAFGRTRIEPVDAETALTSYLEAMAADRSQEAFEAWMAGRSEEEIAVIPVIVGFTMLNEIEGTVFSDSTTYSHYEKVIRLIESGVSAIDRRGNRNALYMTTSDAGLLPVRFILAIAYDRAYRYEDADTAFMNMAKEVGRDFGTDSEEFVFWSLRSGEAMQRKERDYGRAIDQLLPAKEAALHSPEVTDSTACEFLVSLARDYQRSGNHSEALSLAREAEKRTGSNNRLIFIASTLLGELYWIDGQHDKASKYYDWAGTSAPTLDDFFAAGINYANIMRQTGYYDEAESTLLALKRYVESDELAPDALFNYYEALGVLYTFTNPGLSADYFREAERYVNVISHPEFVRHILNSQVYPYGDNSFRMISAIDRAMAIYDMLVGDDPRLVNELLMQKGYYLMNVHDYKTARDYIEKAYLRMLDYAAGDPQRLQVLKLLARLEEIDGNEARRHYYLGLQLRDAEAHGQISDAYLDAVADMLNFCLQTGNEDDARCYLDIYQAHRPGAFDAMCYGYRFRLQQGRVDEARRMLDSIKASHPDQSALVNLMYQRFYAGMASPAITEVAEKVFAGFRNEMLRQLLFMSDNERRNMDNELKARRNEIVTAIRFAPDVTRLALDYSLFSKGLLFHTRNEIDKLLVSSDSANMEIAIIKGLKSELTRALNMSERKRANSIQRAIDSRERYLIDDYLDKGSFVDRFNRYGSDSLIARIGPTDIMAEFVEYADSANSCLGVFVTGSGLPVRFVALGSRDEVSTGNAYELIWRKTLPFTSQHRNIFFSADGILNTLPIEFAEDANGVAMCEKFEMHRVFHLSDIRESPGIGDMVEAIGVADHNSPYGEARRLDDGYRGNWNDLAGVETELYRIAESLDGVSRYHRAFNDEATEQYVKSLSGQPITTLHISTHGFYRGENQLANALNDSTDFDHNMAKRLQAGNRNSVSGLIMRNGNQSWKAPMVNDEEDNILTSEEVETLSFPKLNLTVLSACETALGDLSADGVWGLQRAFRIAGSASLICSLRRVNDSATADFMAEFYHQAASGASVHDAFYKARKELILQDPANKVAWSSFILIE